MSILFPIENLLAEIQDKHHSAFPEKTPYSARYETALGKLQPLYKTINPAMAKEGLFTDHGPDHFDEVIRYLGELVPLDRVAPDGLVTPYELFVILLAARIHDVGNYGGRVGHEQRCYQTLQSIGDGADVIERSIIASIAQAHGGHSTRGCKDTISDIPLSTGVFSIDFNARKCAALVRIADEICENRTRSFENLDFSDVKDKESEIFHAYASCISRNSFSSGDRQLTICFDIPIVMLDRQFTKLIQGTVKNILLIEEIAIRLEKLNLERKYCNTYLPEALRIRGIKVTIRAYNNEFSIDGDVLPLKLIEITKHDFQDIGYPAPSEKLTTLWPDLAPEVFTNLVRAKVGIPKNPPQFKRSLIGFFKKRTD